MNTNLKRIISLIISLSFSLTSLPVYPAAQTPLPEGLLFTTPKHTPWALKGIKIYPDDPLKFDFLLDEGDAQLSEQELKKESELLIKYFLAALTLPEEDLWVNLSPYEEDKIIPGETSQTELGKGLLEQDYLLKRLVSSLTYPEADLGKDFWQKVYAQAFQRFGTTKIPVNTFNKVWIVPDKALVYEDGERALIEESSLKVMMEQDYLAFKERSLPAGRQGTKLKEDDEKNINDLSSSVMKEVVIPAIEEEVNSGENFATLRKMYRSFILASWFKKRLKESLLGEVYVDKKKTKGIDIDEPGLKEKIYEQYLASYKDGLYNYIKTDYSPQEKRHIKRRYWSGGIGLLGTTGLAGSPVVRTLGVSPSFVDNSWNGQYVTAALVSLENARLPAAGPVVEGAGVVAGSPLIPTVDLEDGTLFSTKVPRPNFFEIYNNLSNLWDTKGDYKLALYHLVKRANEKKYLIPEKFSLLLQKRKLLDSKGEFLLYVQAVAQKFFEAPYEYSTLKLEDNNYRLEGGFAATLFSEATVKILTRKEKVYTLWQYYDHVMRRIEVFLEKIFSEAAEKRQKSIYYYHEYLPSGDATKDAINELSFEGKKALTDYLLTGDQENFAKFTKAQKIADRIAKDLLVFARLGYYLYTRFEIYPSRDDMNELWPVLNNLVKYVSRDKRGYGYIENQLETELQELLADTDENIKDVVKEIIIVANNYWTEASSSLANEKSLDLKNSGGSMFTVTPEVNKKVVAQVLPWYRREPSLFGKISGYFVEREGNEYLVFHYLSGQISLNEAVEKIQIEKILSLEKTEEIKYLLLALRIARDFSEYLVPLEKDSFDKFWRKILSVLASSRKYGSDRVIYQGRGELRDLIISSYPKIGKEGAEEILSLLDKYFYYDDDLIKTSPPEKEDILTSIEIKKGEIATKREVLRSGYQVFEKAIVFLGNVYPAIKLPSTDGQTGRYLPYLKKSTKEDDIAIRKIGEYFVGYLFGEIAPQEAAQGLAEEINKIKKESAEMVSSEEAMVLLAIFPEKFAGLPLGYISDLVVRGILGYLLKMGQKREKEKIIGSIYSAGMLLPSFALSPDRNREKEKDYLKEMLGRIEERFFSKPLENYKGNDISLLDYGGKINRQVKFEILSDQSGIELQGFEYGGRLFKVIERIRYEPWQWKGFPDAAAGQVGRYRVQDTGGHQYIARIRDYRTAEEGWRIMLLELQFQASSSPAQESSDSDSSRLSHPTDEGWGRRFGLPGDSGDPSLIDPRKVTQQLSKDEDVSSDSSLGGIALDEALLDLKTKGASSPLGYKFDPQKLQAISSNLAGFQPKIISLKRNGD